MMGPKGFDPLTIGLEVQHSIQAELWAQETKNFYFIKGFTTIFLHSSPFPSWKETAENNQQSFQNDLKPVDEFFHIFFL